MHEKEYQVKSLMLREVNGNGAVVHALVVSLGSEETCSEVGEAITSLPNDRKGEIAALLNRVDMLLAGLSVNERTAPYLERIFWAREGGPTDD